MNVETFCEQFATFAESPSGVEKLREMILQLAAIGKLCPQNSSEESASELLSRIRDAVKIRYASGEIRRRENSLACAMQADLIPNGWSFVSLGEIADVNWGNTALTKSSYTETGVTAFSATGPDGFIGHAEFSGPGIVLSAIGARSGKCFLADGQWTAIKNTITIIPFAPVSNDWLFRTVNRELAWKKRGGAQPFIALKDAVSLPILLPPLAEQKRIVEKVDQLLGLCDELASRQAARREARVRLVGATLDRLVSARSSAEFPTHVHRVRDNFDRLFDAPTTIPQLRQAILQLAVQGQLVPQDPNDENTDSFVPEFESGMDDGSAQGRPTSLGLIELNEWPFRLPDSWRLLRLGDVAQLKHGYAFKSAFFTEDETPFVLTTPGNFYETGGFRDRGQKTKYYSGSVPDGFILKSGDLIIPMTEQAAGLLGSPAFIPNDGKNYLHNQRLGKLDFNCQAIIPEFAYWLFNTQYFRSQLAATCTGMKVRHTSPRKILLVPIPIPPLAEQKRIVSKVAELLSLCDALEAKLTQTESASSELLSSAISQLLCSSN